MQHMLTEYGMGTSLRRGDYTQAAKRALQNALWHNSINLAELFDLPKEAMRIAVDVAVQRPDAVDLAGLEEVFPYGQVTFKLSQGGLDIPRPEGHGNPTVIAHVSLSVSLDMERVS
ncbi:Lin0512 family protein [Lentibacter algarum]|uniref:Lin0512 family protein n=1 Tax=Lentibacter algarum TaxID=576131 RepID=UPI001C06C4EB|nr:Lin0512 family protein [Lentibacter algarum]MBU2982283.1 Lin0512 family protein [Lentibacter algarum]